MITNGRGEIITFYSYKGGTGRSMALANVGCILAEQETSRNGKGVLLIDWDLEAPGLHRYFAGWMSKSRIGMDTVEAEEAGELDPGLIDLFYEFEKSISSLLKERKPNGHGQALTTEELTREVINSVDLSPFILPTTISNLSLIKAGRFDPRNPNDYSARINKFNWEALFTKSPHFMRLFGETLASRYSYVLIDSRTGISDISGVSTMLLPEKLVVVFTPNLQSLRGGLELIRRAAEYRKESVDLRPLTVYPLVSRIESNEPELKKNWRFGAFEIKGYQLEFEEVLSGIYGERVKLNDYFDEIQIQHIPRYAYGEAIAVLLENTSDRLSLSQSYRSFAQKLISEESPWQVEVDEAASSDLPTPRRKGSHLDGPWEDRELETALVEASNTFDWDKAQDICDQIISRIRSDHNPISETFANRLLFLLRRNHRFALISELADVMLESGVRTLRIRRQYAQALIDEGSLTPAEGMLQSIIQDAQQNKTEELEARGLLGRLYKQLYVTNHDPLSPKNRYNIERALEEYLSVYRLNPKENLWHGINVVALVERSKRDGLYLSGSPDSNELAREILLAIETKENNSPEPLYLWDLATKIEALVALGETVESALTAYTYVESTNVDAFEIMSTLRQFEEVWQLKENEGPGNLLLPVLRMGHLTKSGVMVSADPRSLKAEALALDDTVHMSEAVFGSDKMQDLRWYKRCLDASTSIARIESRGGKGQGTGWLVNAEDFFPDERGVLLLTNNHIVSSSPNFLALFPQDCQINFQASGQIMEVEEDAFWYSPHIHLDATFLKLKGDPLVPPLRISQSSLHMSHPAPRLYTMSCLPGRDSQVSIQDSYLLARNENLFHHRTPTEAISSGSPIFVGDTWEVVALHHRAADEIRRIDGKDGTYYASEAISILALQEQTRTSSTYRAAE